MRSSRAYAASSLEVPAVTVADGVAAALVLLAGLFAAWACARAGAVGLAVLAGATAGGIAGRGWTGSRRRPPLVLERLPDGRLQVREGAGTPVPLVVGARTRLLGPSVFLDVTLASTSKTVRCRRWITAFDVPAQALRRWTVLLPHAGSMGS